MFGFRVTYLRGSVTAANIRTGNEKDAVEWPPHPDRLFCALVQAWGDLGESQSAREALEWLEGPDAPLIRCGTLLSSVVVRRFVPVNDEWDPVVKQGKRKGEPHPCITGTLIGRDRKERRIPTGTLSDDTVIFWWPDKVATPQQYESLSGLAGAAASFGHSSSLVAVEAMNSDEGLIPSWVPQPGGSVSLRVPQPGRLSVLSKAFRAQPKRLRPPESLWVSYGKPGSSEKSARGDHRDLFVFRLVSDRAPLPLEATHRVLSLWRRALLSKADQPVSEIISGHSAESTRQAPIPSKRSHLALLPLPDVGHQYARSHLMGVGAALPSDVSAPERNACLRALGRVEELVDDNLGKLRLERCSSEESRNGLWPETWCKGARIWGSVTPVVFGRYPDELFGAEAVRMARGACGIAGLPDPLEVIIAPVSWVLGVPPANRFPPLQSRPGKPRRAHAHVRLVFSQKVAGPVLVGAGRHQGYGLFRQLNEDES